MNLNLWLESCGVPKQYIPPNNELGEGSISAILSSKGVIVYGPTSQQKLHRIVSIMRILRERKPSQGWYLSASEIDEIVCNSGFKGIIVLRNIQLVEKNQHLKRFVSQLETNGSYVILDVPDKKTLDRIFGKDYSDFLTEIYMEV